MQAIEFLLNGRPIRIDVQEREILLTTLRERLDMKGVKEGCSIGECGVCTVLIDDVPHYSCLTLASKVDGRGVKTVEFLGSTELLHPLQEAFIESGAIQCGYCTPGMLLSAYSLLARNEDPDEWAIREAISGNLCRCTGYVQIIEAVRKAGVWLRSSKSGYPVAGRRSSERGRNGTPEERRIGETAEVKSKFTIRDSYSELEASRQVTAKTGIPTKEEIVQRLADEPNATIIAGGTDLLVRARKGHELHVMVDVSRVAGLNDIVESKGKIRIGAAVTHAKIADNPLIRERAASLSQASGQVGSPQVRNMGTLGGNLVNASPAADSLPPLLIHDGRVTLESSRGLREIPIEEFIRGPYRTTILPGELLTSIRIDSLSGYREGYRRVTRRAALAVSRLSVAWAIAEKEGYFQDLKLSIGSCTPMPFRARDAEIYLKGREKSGETISRAVEVISEGLVRESGIRPSYVYKLPVLRDLVTEILKG